MTASPHRQIPQFIPFAEAASLLSPTATERTLRTYRDRKWLRAFKVGRVWHTTADDIEDVAEKLGLDVVPIVGEGTLSAAVEFVQQGFRSTWGDFPAEGVVARPAVQLLKRNGGRIITKIKTRDFC